MNPNLFRYYIQFTWRDGTIEKRYYKTFAGAAIAYITTIADYGEGVAAHLYEYDDREGKYVWVSSRKFLPEGLN